MPSKPGELSPWPGEARCLEERRPSFVYYDQKTRKHGEVPPLPTLPITPIVPSTTIEMTSLEEVKNEKQVSKATDSEDGDETTWSAIFRRGLQPFGHARWPPITTYLIATALFLMFSGELLLSRQSSGEFLELDPFNIMIGPSIEIMIQCGARFPPCMRNTSDMPSSERYICLNTTTTTTTTTTMKNVTDRNDVPLALFDPVFDQADPRAESSCSLEDICGMGGFDGLPNQSFRFLTALFVHTGMIHFGINLAAHLLLGIRLEKTLNAIRFALLYVASGVFGNIFGANFAPPTTPLMGCSGSLFGLLAGLFVDLGLHWSRVHQPFRHFIKLLVFVAMSFVLGLLPGVDNFSHMGGFMAGLLVSVLIMPAPPGSRRFSLCVWTLRVLALALLVALSFILVKGFYTGQDPDEFCSYCRYVSCLPIGGFCD